MDVCVTPFIAGARQRECVFIFVIIHRWGEATLMCVCILPFIGGGYVNVCLYLLPFIGGEWQRECVFVYTFIGGGNVNVCFHIITIHRWGQRECACL